MGVLHRFSKKNTAVNGESPRFKTHPSPSSSVVSHDTSSTHSLDMSFADLEATVCACLDHLESDHEDDLLALKELFTLSMVEDTPNSSRRHDMICVADGKLLGFLLDYIQSHDGIEKQTALLLIHNLSAAYENKRPLAMSGAGILVKMLRKDPSCHLLAIILMHLSFSDAELRRDLVTNESIELIESLALLLIVCSMSKQDFTSNGQRLLSVTPSIALFDLVDNDDSSVASPSPVPMEVSPVYPETVKWIMCALKNLTRPSKYDAAAHALLKAGVVPTILRFVTRGNSTKWDATRDAALYLVVHLAAIPSARTTLREIAPPALAALTPDVRPEVVESEVLVLQRVKARMALAYLCGSEGHYGQPLHPRKAKVDEPDTVDSSTGSGSGGSGVSEHHIEEAHKHLLINDKEATHLVELLANMMHNRAKHGPAGYSTGTFSVKYVLFAIRCLLTHTHNQRLMATSQGLQLNTLLMKVLAFHVWDSETVCIDPEAAEHASFSLYLMSNLGFEMSFLPTCYGSDEDLRKSFAAKVLVSYRCKDQVTPAGKHAAHQLLLRLRYLRIEKTPREIVTLSGWSRTSSDFVFDDATAEAALKVEIDELKFGCSPRKDIFDRPILRSKVAGRQKGQQSPFSRNFTDDFPSALLAAQDLSFGSTKVRHAGEIDVVQIANNIANSANGEKTQSYNYIWSWKDTAGKIQKSLHRQMSDESFMSFSRKTHRGKTSSSKSRGGIFSSFRCGLDRLCGPDTTLEDPPMAESRV